MNRSRVGSCDSPATHQRTRLLPPAGHVDAGETSLAAAARELAEEPHVYIKEVGSTGRRINQSFVEEDAFWVWAVIETLRHTGVRAEELTELTHLALVSYKLLDQLPNKGEVVPLLQIVPSKSNEERLLLVSPELASVLATIIKCLRDATAERSRPSRAMTPTRALLALRSRTSSSAGPTGSRRS
ncbi:NUDIX domain-containing protein [Streptomyces sp. NBC_00299]|uniref:NUDIX domain-containing protein n=1 Tax=Streptomyces sp. NBC_00299 TaxID=2975705 RepID=UPI002E2D0FC9|nr:NUDIX domain-containing protein [Streptomyces sp. NBC_00299]